MHKHSPPGAGATIIFPSRRRDGKLRQRSALGKQFPRYGSGLMSSRDRADTVAACSPPRGGSARLDREQTLRKSVGPMIELHTWNTPNGRKISVALEEMGLPYTVKPVNISKGEQFNPEFLAL